MKVQSDVSGELEALAEQLDSFKDGQIYAGVIVKDMRLCRQHDPVCTVAREEADDMINDVTGAFRSSINRREWRNRMRNKAYLVATSCFGSFSDGVLQDWYDVQIAFEGGASRCRLGRNLVVETFATGLTHQLLPYQVDQLTFDVSRDVVRGAKLTAPDLRKCLKGEKCSVVPYYYGMVVQSDIRRAASSALRSMARSKWAAEPEVSTERVQLYLDGEPPWVDGVEQNVLTEARYNAVFALVDASPARLSKDDLFKAVNGGEPHKRLKEVANSSTQWAEVLSFPDMENSRFGYAIG